MLRLRAVLAVPALAVLLAACPGGDGDDGATTTTPPPTSTTTTGETTTTAPDTTTTTAPCPAFTAGTTEAEERDPQGAPVFLTDVELSAQRCEAEVRFVLEGDDGEPGWQVEYAQPPFRQPSSQPVEVEGDAFLRIVLHNVSGVDLGGDVPRETYTGPDELDGEGFVREVQLVSDFEAVMEWVVGLDARRPYTIEVEGDAVVVTIGSRG